MNIPALYALHEELGKLLQKARDYDLSTAITALNNLGAETIERNDELVSLREEVRQWRILVNQDPEKPF